MDKIISDDELFEGLEKQLLKFTKNISYIIRRYEDSYIIVAISDINDYKATEMIKDIDYESLRQVSYKLAERIGNYTYKNCLYKG